ncbi:MAG: amidohydrolase family protein, partial [Phycisphaerales bacterium JB061]
PSMQPTHCTSDMRWVEERVGPVRADGAYVWQSLLASGVRIAGGSDFPVESHNPFLGLYAAVTRQNLDEEPRGGWRPTERMTREQALRSFTIDAAFAGFNEKNVGSIEVDKLADFIVIDRDYMTCPDREIADIVVLSTWIEGTAVFNR